MTKNKRLMLNIGLFILVLGALHAYRLYLLRDDPKDCIKKHGFATVLPTAKSEVSKACHILAQSKKADDSIFNTKQRALALCILRDPLALGTKDEHEIINYLEPCYTAYLKK